jgi:hypothetical protein
VSTPFFQGLDPQGAPDPVTPAVAPAVPAQFGAVTPHGRGPAEYDIAAPQDIAGIGSALDAAGGLSGAGVLYPQGPRQSEAAALLDSPQGSGAMSVLAGFPDYEDADVNPGGNMANPIQSQGPSSGPYPGTVQADVPMFDDGLGAGVPGVPPEGGNMGPGGGDYPGTTQDGLAKYGTS